MIHCRDSVPPDTDILTLHEITVYGIKSIQKQNFFVDSKIKVATVIQTAFLKHVSKIYLTVHLVVAYYKIN